jgi:hypothetical protein
MTYLRFFAHLGLVVTPRSAPYTTGGIHLNDVKSQTLSYGAVRHVDSHRMTWLYKNFICIQL